MTFKATGARHKGGQSTYRKVRRDPFKQVKPKPNKPTILSWIKHEWKLAKIRTDKLLGRPIE